MKKRKGSFFVLFLFVSCFIIISKITAQEQKEAVIRLGYAQAREYSSFAQQLLMIAEELEKEGSIQEGFSKKYQDINYDENFTNGDTLILWKDICKHNVEGARYQFVEEAFFDMNILKKDAYLQMVNREDVDLTFVMGTSAGVYFKQKEMKNKFMVLLAADPIGSGIVKNERERYTKNSFALIDNTTYLRQLEAGYKFLKFKKLGIVYENSENAYAYSAIDSVKQEAKKLGFEILTVYVEEPKVKKEEKRYYRELKKAYRTLVDQGMDALYITVSSIDYPHKLQEILEDSVFPNGIPTLAQDDVIPVISGALFGVSLVDYSEQAYHIIYQLRSYVEDRVPFDKLEQVCECTPKIFLNYTTAEKIGFDISFEDLQLVDSIYR